jgi:transcriptional regulator with XRE-family HTH domain
MTEEAGGFGARLRSFRRLAAMTQEELAERSGVSVRTIGNLEHGRPHRPYRSTCEALADALGLRGTVRAQFVATGRRPGKTATAVGAEQPDGAGQPAADLPMTAPRHLPAPVPSFVGRCDELAELSRVLSRPGEGPSLAVVSGPRRGQPGHEPAAPPRRIPGPVTRARRRWPASAAAACRPAPRVSLAGK